MTNGMIETKVIQTFVYPYITFLERNVRLRAPSLRTEHEREFPEQAINPVSTRLRYTSGFVTLPASLHFRLRYTTP